jgi:hypothetical protein
MKEGNEARARKSMVQVMLTVEHCAYLQNPVSGSHMGEMKASASKCIPVQTPHAPFDSIEATSILDIMREMGSFYADCFGSLHQEHLVQALARVGLLRVTCGSDFLLATQESGSTATTDTRCWRCLGLMCCQHPG